MRILHHAQMHITCILHFTLSNISLHTTCQEAFIYIFSCRICTFSVFCNGAGRSTIYTINDHLCPHDQLLELDGERAAALLSMASMPSIVTRSCRYRCSPKSTALPSFFASLCSWEDTFRHFAFQVASSDKCSNSASPWAHASSIHSAAVNWNINTMTAMDTSDNINVPWERVAEDYRCINLFRCVWYQVPNQNDNSN